MKMKLFISQQVLVGLSNKTDKPTPRPMLCCLWVLRGALLTTFKRVGNKIILCGS